MQPNSRRTARRLLPVGAVVSAALLLSACAGGGTPSGPTLDLNLVSQLPAATGDVDAITWNLTMGEPDTLDPIFAGTYSAGQVVGNLCESILTVDADFAVQPNLVDYDQVSPTELVLTLQQGATFWDGSPVTAEDVAYSLNRAADPSALVSYVYANVASIDVTTADQVTVTFSAPDTLFIPEMATIAGAVVQQAFAETAGAGFGTADGGLLCSGPFQLASWQPGSSITIERYDGYWNAERAAHAASVEFTFITDTTALAQALSVGEVDGAYELPAGSFSLLSSTDAGALTFGPSTQSLQLYVAGPAGPTADPSLRAAFQHLVNREAIADAVYLGAADPLYAFISPTTWPAAQASIYQPAYDELASARAYDLEEAKRLVGESAYAGEELVIGIPAGDDTLSKIAQVIQESAKSAGVTVAINALQPLTYAQATYDPAAREGLDFLMMQSFNGVQDPLEPAGFTWLPGAFYNYTEFDDPAVTDALGIARSTFEGPEQAEAYLEAQTVYEAANATIPILALYQASFTNARLTGTITSFAYWSMPQMAFVGSAE